MEPFDTFLRRICTILARLGKKKSKVPPPEPPPPIPQGNPPWDPEGKSPPKIDGDQQGQDALRCCTPKT